MSAITEREILVKAGTWEAVGKLGFEEAYRRLHQIDPLTEAVKRMEAVPLAELVFATQQAKSANGEIEAVRARLIQAAQSI